MEAYDYDFFHIPQQYLFMKGNSEEFPFISVRAGAKNRYAGGGMSHISPIITHQRFSHAHVP